MQKNVARSAPLKSICNLQKPCIFGKVMLPAGVCLAVSFFGVLVSRLTIFFAYALRLLNVLANAEAIFKL